SYSGTPPRSAEPVTGASFDGRAGSARCAVLSFRRYPRILSGNHGPAAWRAAIAAGVLGNLVGHADGLLDAARVIQSVQHVVCDVGARHEPATRDVAPVRGAIRAGERLVGQPWRSDDRPIQPAVAQHVLHLSEVGIVRAKRKPRKGAEQV